MMKNCLGLGVLMGAFVMVPTAARAADYHHVHLAAPNVPETVRWDVTHVGCTAMARADACEIGTTRPR
ncbi:MAG: hypothetical protein HY701_14850 [Gemmatimonadetes bacterium]|nr:hypothetical protein [Gemmatimonadota bacterium]